MAIWGPTRGWRVEQMMRPIERVWRGEGSLSESDWMGREVVSGVVIAEDIARWWRPRRVAGRVFAILGSPCLLSSFIPPSRLGAFGIYMSDD